MKAAVSFAWVFRCSPFEFLDRPRSDYPALMALLSIADDRMKKEAADRGQW